MAVLEALGKALLGMVLKPLGKKVAQAVLGPAHVNAAAAVAERTLTEVVVDLLEPYGVDGEQAGHLSATLLYSLSRAAETGPTDDVFDAEARPATVRRLLDVLRDSPDFDADTFQVYVDGGTVPVDVAMVLDEFLTRFPRELQLAAEEGPPLADLVILRRLTAQDRKLDRLEQSMAVLVPSAGADGEDVARSARNRIANDIARRRHPDAGDRVLIDSSALTEWADYAGTASWRHGVGHRVAALAAAARHRPELRPHAAALDGFDASGTFVSVVVRLGRLPLGAMLAAVRTALSHLDPEDDGDRPLRRELLGLRADLRWLRSEVDEPRFRACFACVGSWGSGRSRLVTELAETAVSDGDFALFLPPAPAETSLEAHVLTGAGRLFARPFASLEDLGLFLDQVLDADLHLLLDDADEWCAGRAGALDDLQDTIAAATAHDRLRWTLTAEHSRFHALLSDDRSRARFWPAYVWASVMDPGPDGWLDLDASNVRQSIGLQLLEDHGPPGIRAELAELGRDPASFRYETTLLNSPLVAWLHVDPDPDGSGSEHPVPVVDVHAGAVIRRFWDRRKVALGRGDREQADALEQVVLLLARHWAGGAARSAPMRDLIGVLDRPDAVALLQRPASARALLIRLGDAGVLQVTSEGDAELDLPEEFVTPRLAPLWGYRVARPMADTAQRDRAPSQAFLAAARPFLASAAAGQPLDSAVCEIGLRLLAEGPASPRAKKDVWTRWLDDPDAPKPPAWLAAVGSPPAAQGAVAGWLAHHEHEPADKREWFALLRLLAGAGTIDWQAQQRLAVVSHAYARIGDLGLGPYLEWVIGRIVGDLELCTAHNYAAVLGRLTGTELADAADAAAGAVTAPALEIFRDDCFAWLRNVVKFLKTVTVTPAPHREDTDSTRPHVYAFWQHLVRAVAGRVVDEHGLGAFDELAGAGWYSSEDFGVDRRVGLRMREEANVSLGFWYQRHSRDRDAVAAYLRLVATLVDRRAPDVPTDRQRAVAFYLIRHSELTRREPTKVKERFHPLLSVLCADPDLADLPHLRATCIANGMG